MLLWIIYILACLYISYQLCYLVPSKFRLFLFIIIITGLITPATVEIGSDQLAPSLFVFFYDLILEQQFSFRSLKPIILMIPLSVILYGFILIIKRKFF